MSTQQQDPSTQDDPAVECEDWPEGFEDYLADLPDLDRELSEIISEMEGLRALADSALLVYLNASDGPGEPEAGKLDHRKARAIAPMREDAAKFVWQVYQRVDAFYDLLTEYECKTQERALELARRANGAGQAEGGAS